MARQSNEAERLKLENQIKEWNANRLDLFEITLPDEVIRYASSVI